jgi:hypothetical protein
MNCGRGIYARDRIPLSLGRREKGFSLSRYAGGAKLRAHQLQLNLRSTCSVANVSSFWSWLWRAGGCVARGTGTASSNVLPRSYCATVLAGSGWGTGNLKFDGSVGIPRILRDGGAESPERGSWAKGMTLCR